MNTFIRDAEFLQTFIDAVPSLLFVVDCDVRIIHVNHAASRAIGPQRDLVFMKRGGDILRCMYALQTPEGCGHGSNCPDCAIRNSVDKAFNGESVFREPVAMRVKSREQINDVYFNITATPLTYKDTSLVVLVLDDVTGQKKVEKALSRANQLLELQATTDPLTGIYNQRTFEEVLMKEISRSRRHHIPLSLVMFDIDHFTVINDTCGQDVGDMVLQQLAAHIANSLRKHDYFVRWGGGEFMILLTHNTLATAVHFTEIIRSEVEALKIEGCQGVTCSFGVTQMEEGDDIFSLTKRVDDALYNAKAAGRNRVETL